ncbi:hypothetical protein DS2_11768 [Catenovulum agarivorans DS-2]|uniref:Uncharacterized protein n=1 Tax=Catenovulum agarivorans DS-2 TaxID=1328313 RepID=W7QA23_9ALTE|nr:hypothetical protein [Catenovulum agarivorans]EWH09644.1 hypothetical protein DS2_11768 [Catenovulum agarivorans DS-2]
MNKSKIILLLTVLLYITGCSTREAGKQFSGSTEQRLITYSINKIAADFANQPLQAIQGQTIQIESHFVVKNNVVDYATAKIKSQLTETFGTRFVEASELPLAPAQYTLKLFFTSLGTDRDSAGFSFPIINLSEPERSTSISVLAVDMYHGISECNYVLVDTRSNQIVSKGQVSARVKTDNFTTPLFSVPISDID